MKYQNTGANGIIEKLVEENQANAKEVTCKESVVQISVDFSTVTLDANRQWSKTFNF